MKETQMTLPERLFISFWKRKTAFGAILALSALVGLAITQFYPFRTKATVRIAPISNYAAIPYQDPSLARFIQVDRNILLEMYLNVLESRSLFRQVSLDQKLVVRKPDESEIEFDQRLSLFVDRISIIAPTPASIRAGFKDYQIEFSTRNPEQGYNFLKETFDSADQQVKSNLQNLFKTQAENYKLNQKYTRRDLETARDNMLADYDRQTSIRLAGLDEQATLLRTTRNLDTRAVAVPEVSSQSSAVTASVVDTSKIVILPGADHLEKQAELIRSRKDKEDFIEGLFPIQQKLRDLDQDQLVARSQAAYDRTPLASNNFRAAFVDLTRASFRKGIWPLVAFAGSLGVGLLICFGLLLAGTLRIPRPTSK
jgi:hypothetical protein